MKKKTKEHQTHVPELKNSFFKVCSWCNYRFYSNFNHYFCLDISMDGMFLAMENQIADICAQISILGGVVFFFSYFQVSSLFSEDGSIKP